MTSSIPIYLLILSSSFNNNHLALPGANAKFGVPLAYYHLDHCERVKKSLSQSDAIWAECIQIDKNDVLIGLPIHD
jgi:hypothetical protein